MKERLGFAGKFAHAFIDSKLTPLIIAASILLGVGAVLMLPREEEPQIVVPMVDLFVQMPGASAKEVEERVTKPMEKLLWEIPGVEYIYSTSAPGRSMAIVRFQVGEDEEKSIVRLNQKMFANFDLIPPAAGPRLRRPAIPVGEFLLRKPGVPGGDRGVSGHRRGCRTGSGGGRRRPARLSPGRGADRGRAARTRGPPPPRPGARR